MFTSNDVVLQRQVMQKLIGTLFTTRNFAHCAHLNTNKYSTHKALEEFYDGIVDLADTLTEVWQGRTLTLIGDIPVYKIKSCTCDVLEEFKTHLELIESLRKELDEDSAIQTLIDDIVDLYLRTIYKLKFLNDSTPQTMASKTNTSASIDSDVDNDNFFNNMTNTEDEEV